MLNRAIKLVIFTCTLGFSVSSATTLETTRTPQFSNKKVSVWETTIYPGLNQTLQMHRHEHDRVVVALTNGLLKITNDKGKIHYLRLSKNHAYFLAKDIGDELHNDMSMTSSPIKVMVIELKN
jgi:hypothetical protein